MFISVNKSIPEKTMFSSPLFCIVSSPFMQFTLKHLMLVYQITRHGGLLVQSSREILILLYVPGFLLLFLDKEISRTHILMVSWQFWSWFWPETGCISGERRLQGKDPKPQKKKIFGYSLTVNMGKGSGCSYFRFLTRQQSLLSQVVLLHVRVGLYMHVKSAWGH